MDGCKRTMCHQKVTPVIVVHGGAQTFQPEQFKKLAGGTKAAARAGYKVLTSGGSALDAVTAAVTVLENDPTFDAGTGSVLTAKGEVEMDAVIMDGKTLNSGSVACVRNIKNPIALARRVMEKTDHCLLVGPGANMFAEEQGIKQVNPESLITPEARKEYEEFKDKGYDGAVSNMFGGRNSSGQDTTGAIAMDCHGNIAYGTSTGGITGKRTGRVGDSPLAGAGGYADNEVGAVSCTGHGESILKVVLAHQIISKMRLGTGSVLTAKGEVEMDAVIMDGKTLNSGSVACVQNIKNPIALAKRVMEKTDHCLLVGPGANMFAEEQGIKQVKPESLITPEAKKEYEEFKDKGYGGAVSNMFGGRDSSGHDTTGAIAMDCHGNIAYGTSTGGITGKRTGRVGDSPLAGAGGYADNEVGAVSCTGHGESILKVVLAHQIISKMRLGMLPHHAGKDSLANMVSRVNGFGGVIILDKKGHVATPFTTNHMAWAWAKDGMLHHGIKPKDNFVESINNYEN